jgi:hypothetical protein
MRASGNPDALAGVSNAGSMRMFCAWTSCAWTEGMHAHSNAITARIFFMIVSRIVIMQVLESINLACVPFAAMAGFA